jgi:hypothetical protein
MSGITSGRLTVVVVVFIGLFVCCKRDITTAELYGEYLARYPFGTDKIILSPGGRYVQEVAINGNSDRLVREGHWQFEVPDTPLGFGRIRLDGCLRVVDGLGRLREDFKKPLLCMYPIERDFYFSDRLRLGSDGSAGYPHNKK